MRKISKQRDFVPGATNHVYQISQDYGVIFYDESDYLVCLSVIFTASAKHRVRISALCLMINHIHIQIECSDLKSLRAFESEFSSNFARLYNARHSRSGPLFKTPFGSAPKVSKFEVMDNYVYICNNPVVKYLCPNAWKYRWNLCCYLCSDNPYSEPYLYADASKELREARQRVSGMKARGQLIRYETIDFFRSTLGNREWRQLSDFIVRTYMDIDIGRILSIYGDFATMVTAVNSSKGKENDLREESGGKDYRPYYQMLKIYRGSARTTGPYALEDNEKLKMAIIFKRTTEASIWQIAAFLHLPYEELKEQLRCV